MKKLFQTKQFGKDVKRMRGRGKDVENLGAVVSRLAKSEALEPDHRDHALADDWKHCRDCHIESYWILIYPVDDRSLRLERTRSQAGLFD